MGVMVIPVDPPLSATDAGGMQVQVLWVWHLGVGSSDLWFGWVDGDGRIHQGPAAELTIDFRFTREGKWIDVGPDEMAAAAGPGLSFASEGG